MLHMLDPQLEFRDPQRLVNDASLSLNEKLEILESWKNELILLQRAEEENMPGTEIERRPDTVTLADIAKAIDRLRRLNIVSSEK
jgi:hypothetical protein